MNLIFDFLDAEPRLDYVVAMAKNAVLKRAAEPAMTTARAQSAASGQTEHVYTDVSYAAASWDAPRRVLVKAEVVHLAGRAPQDNPRFVVTNLRQTPRFLYERIYCARGISRIGSKSCTTACSSGGRAVVGSGRINCASSSPPRPMCSCKNCGYARRAPAARAPR